MKGWKVIAGTGAALAAADFGIAAYFFRRTMLRQNASTQRTIDMAGTGWDQYMPMIKEKKEWMLSQPREDVFIQSEDRLKLHGTYFPGNKGKKMVIGFHGYTSSGMKDYIGLSNYYLPGGFRMLLADERAHGESEGTYIGFGCLDRKDVLSWIFYAQELLGEDAEIWLHGISMGAASVLMASGLSLPSCVKGIISDCAFTSAWDVFAHVLKSQYHLPPTPILAAADRMAQRKAGYGLGQCNAAEEVKKAKLPILFIHGDADTFVPSEMCHEIYKNCASPKDILIVPGAGHAEAFYKDPEGYQKKIMEFMEKKGV